MGPLKENHVSLSDAAWYEKTAAVVLVAGIVLIGIMPGWLNDLVRPGAEIIMNKLTGK